MLASVRLVFLARHKRSAKLKWIFSTKPISISRCLSGRGPGPSGQSYMHCPSPTPYVTSTVGQVVKEAAAEVPDRLALVVCHENVRKTYQQLDKDVDAFAAGLISLGLRKGERVGIWGPNSYEWILSQFAAARAGLILVNINPAYRSSELEFSLKMVDCSAVITAETFKSQDYYKILSSVVPEIEDAQGTDLKLTRLPNLRTVILTGNSRKPGTWNFQDVVSAAKSEDFQSLSQISSQFDDACNIQYTSGTTGRPKAATLSHFNIINNAYFVGKRLGYAEQVPVLCMQVPLYHCFGCVLGSLSCFLYRGTCVIPSAAFHPQASMQAIHNEKCTVIYGTPTMYVDILNLPDFKSYDTSRLKTGVMSGASCPVELVKDVKEQMGIQEILIPYGCTETSPVCTLTSRDDPESKKLTTVGRPLDAIEVKVVDDSGAVTTVGVVGEVCLRGYATFLGYWGQDDKTKEALKQNKWYYTGDNGRMDEDGYLYIAGRKTEMINRGGENVYPREIEEFLMAHPQVADVHVCGVPDKRMGEEVCAWIALQKDAGNLSPDDIKTYCKGKISYFKIPRYIIFTQEFPKTVTGKVQKFRMREQSMKLLALEE